MMDDSERFMISYQKQNAISLYSDTSSSNNDENYDDVPKMFQNKNQKSNHKRKIDDFMLEYKREVWTDKDFRLLNGVFNKQQLSNQEMDKYKAQNQRIYQYQSDSEIKCVGIEDKTPRYPAEGYENNKVFKYKEEKKS
mmetsp:Transcript_12872/g.11406  ORF Transcript_12872/g.11406 Transcript_12872/m.11406 type:complete len:138 (+) Transcript_12872:2-415(+)